MGTLDPDVAFELLSNQRRRHVLCVLAERDAELTVQELATEIVDRLAAEESSAGSSPQYQSVYVSLYQNHLPRLAEHGIVSYDDESRSVALVKGDRTRQLLAILDESPERSWRRAYVAVAVVVVLTTLATVFEIVSTPGSPWVLPAATLGLGLLVVGVLQYATRHRLSNPRFSR